MKWNKKLFILPVLAIASPLLYKYITNLYNDINDHFETTGRKLADDHLVPTNAAVNAVVHCYTSAQLTMSYGSFITRLLGDAREYIDSFTKEPKPKDAWKDLYNNSVGIEIAKKCKNNGLNIEEEVIKAYNSNLLINSTNDPRINLNQKPYTTLSKP